MLCFLLWCRPRGSSVRRAWLLVARVALRSKGCGIWREPTSPGLGPSIQAMFGLLKLVGVSRVCTRGDQGVSS